ncbi:GD10680 [Drosophila simulans]|uniref:GD10680 n=1 Tax=Drosophila simulans TaxID=7240 RepID=B4QHQ3_DROSI|nr:GD10680 [Drosophila simulans]
MGRKKKLPTGVSSGGSHASSAPKSVGGCCVPLGLPQPLLLEEKKFLLAVERGDMPNVRRILQKALRHQHININCMDPLGRRALTLAIDNENLEMVELLVVMGVETKDALLHAINAEFVEAVELLLEHEELIYKEGEPYKALRHQHININCMDPLGRRALTLAIDNENLEMVELLVVMGVETKDALLHAINAEFVEAVELLLEHEELIYKEGEPYFAQQCNNVAERFGFGSGSGFTLPCPCPRLLDQKFGVSFH